MLGGGRVLELLFGPEEGVEDGLAGVLAEDQGDPGGDQGEQDQAAEPLLRFFGGAQALGGLAQVLGRLARSFWTFLSLVTALTAPLPLPVARP